MAYVGIAGRQGLIRRIEKKLREKGAISEKTRVTMEEAELSSGFELNMVKFLVGQGKIGKAKDGKIWWKEQISHAV